MPYPQLRAMITMCPRPESHLTYMAPVTIATEFTLADRGEWSLPARVL
jgi:hypothetical protein